MKKGNKNLIFVIGATATGKSTFIAKHFADKDNVIILNIYDYQQAAYEEAGFGAVIPLNAQYRCLYKANENLLTDIIKAMRQNKNVVVEHTLLKAKRRIGYIDEIRQLIENANIEFYVMSPIDSVWQSYIEKRKLESSFESYKSMAAQIEFPNPCEGIDKIYEVNEDNICLRMDKPTPEILSTARQELLEEAQKLYEVEVKEKEKADLLDSMKTRPFWHYCESCGRKEFITAGKATDEGWDYPPTIGTFGLLGPRTCPKCSLTDTLFWKVQQQKLPIVIETILSADELKTWKRIKGEPKSLLDEENSK